ncbi:MAG: hypothetical protein IPP98_03895 [Gemmatimonadetes bacterium]|nr:hypothetical protein [Gemmatimonadota bacterium]
MLLAVPTPAVVVQRFVDAASATSDAITALLIAISFMIFFADAISGFVDRHPTVKMLALSFLLLIGVTLVAEGLGQHSGSGLHPLIVEGHFGHGGS